METNKEEILARQSKLSAAKRALLEKRLRGEVETNSGSQIIPRRSSTSPAPLSFAQARLWFLHQFDPGSAFYNEPIAVHLKGSLDIAVLEQSFNEIVRRHETLRTTFEMVEGQPVQVIHPAVTVKLSVAKLGELPEAEQKAQIQQLAIEATLHPFDLVRGLLFRLSLLQLNETEHVLLLIMHHIVFDGWSVGVLVQELAELYAAFSSRQPSSLSELPIQYADFAVWQRQWLQGEVLENHLAYWKHQLGGSLTVLDLPTDHPRPAVQTFKGAKQFLVLPEELSEALKNLSKQEGVTLFMTLLAAFQTLLHRYTGQDDIIVGTSVANRNQPEIEKLIGFFINSLVLRIDLSGNPTFRDLLARVREVTLGAYAHQDLPFEKLVEVLNPERTLSRTPLFQVMFILQNAPMPPLALKGLTMSPLEVDSGTAKYDLFFSLIDTEQGLTGWVEYDTNLFDAATITRMLGHYKTLLESIVTHREQRLAELPILTEAEQQQLLVKWNNTKTDYPHNQCIHELFQAQVERSPDAVAVVFEDRQLTYRELNRRANQLAHFLEKLGVGPEVLVGIYVERSVEMVIGLLGILKAGGAYVPLDPAYPQERLAFMLTDAQMPVLLTQQHLVAALPEHRAKVVCLDSDWENIAKERESNPVSGITASNRAYAIYTSGSTGKPKGVQICHRAVVNFLNAMSQQPGLAAEDILLSVTTITFDIAALEIFLPITVGARLVLVSREVTVDGAKLIEQLTSSGATVMQATPATWRLLLAAGWQGSKQLKILCGGEALPWELAKQLLEKGATLWNLYGPTETTIWSTVCKVEVEDRWVSIGRPIANTQIYILDRHLQPVPIGIPGELYIGGVGLALGYLNRPELTAEKFITNPFLKAEGRGQRAEGREQESEAKDSEFLYKTGDLARYRSDGRIEYLGRIDHQVKIRGFRIELGEIEAVLGQHPGVRQAVVVAREDEPGNKRLVAYVVQNLQHWGTEEQRAGTEWRDEQISQWQLRGYLKEKLPEYMVPSAFVMLEALPLTPNGKVDRKSLPAPEALRPELEATFVAPRTPVEQILAGIWADTLGIKQVGIHDNFFELGGHSLLATQVISQLHKVLQVNLPLRCLFESPTVAGLAQSISAAIEAGQKPDTLPIEPVSRNRSLPLSFAQQRLWFLDRLQPLSAAYNIPAAVHILGSLNVAALQQSINEIVRRHEALRTYFPVVEGQPIQTISSAAIVPLLIVDLQNLPETEREAEAIGLVSEYAQQPFDLLEGPLLRVKLLQLGTEEHVLLLTIHHIISDAWSAGVFVREAAALYEAFSAGKRPSLPDLPIQYADFAVWQQQWLQGEVLDTQLNYWKQQLDGAKTVLELPTDKPRSALQTITGTKYSFALSPTLSHSLKSLSQQQGVTLFMTLLAAFNTLLYRYTNQADILVGSPIANRNRSEIEGLIGFFANTLVLRTDLSNNPSFRELLQRVREVALGAYSHQDLPFEKLVAELHPERSGDRSPLFQVWFVLQNAPMPPLELPGLTLSFAEAFSGMVRHDLKLELTETPAELQGFFEYKTDLFEATTIARMAKLFETLLATVVEQPDIQLSQLVEILDEAEKQQQILKNQEFKQSRRQKLGNVGRKAITGTLNT